MAWRGFLRALFFSYVPHCPAGPHSPGKAENSVVFLCADGVSQRTFRSTFQFQLSSFRWANSPTTLGLDCHKIWTFLDLHNCWIMQARVLHCLNGGGLMMNAQVYRLMALVTHIIFRWTIPLTILDIVIQNNVSSQVANLLCLSHRVVAAGPKVDKNCRFSLEMNLLRGQQELKSCM